MAEFNLFDLLRKAKKPFEGVGETFSELNLLGSSVPESFKQMRDVGLLDTNAYNDAVAKADKRGKRNALIQGALRFGLQDFNKNVGSAFNPVYLKSPLLSAVDASQKSYDQLPVDAKNKYALSTFKKGVDADARKAQLITKIKNAPEGTYNPDQVALADSMTTPQLIAMVTGQDKKSLSFQTVVGQDGLSQKYQVIGDPSIDKTGPEGKPDGIPDSFVPIGSRYRSREQAGIPDVRSLDSRVILANIANKKNPTFDFVPNVTNSFTIANDIAALAKQLQQIKKQEGNPINSPDAQNQVIQLFKDSNALRKGKMFGGNELYDRNKFINFANEKINNAASPDIDTSTAVIKVNSVEEAKALPKGTKFIDPNGIQRTR